MQATIWRTRSKNSCTLPILFFYYSVPFISIIITISLFFVSSLFYLYFVVVRPPPSSPSPFTPKNSFYLVMLSLNYLLFLLSELPTFAKTQLSSPISRLF
uniref:Uncharacterized protein n=1 Tax=Cacopsylla melanoneura TaxID=428564 RepID=A0A8D8Q3R3_9HEMI